ncbi:ATP-binding protein [Actinomadura soli]|uniref:ATP-binding protein n=1 Tax=Actinomadura soli TaxID=2508997 RepID=UPI0014860229|nr:AAA family ATPase [Actinomadura soli]
MPDVGTVGVADARLLPNDSFEAAWSSIFFPDDAKGRLLQTVVSNIRLRATVPFEALPLHGVVLLTGRPGVGKTTVARGLADKIARTVSGLGSWAFIEIDPHALASSSLGRSQRSVEELFGRLLEEQAQQGPLVVLLDEVETLLTDRAALSMEANPIDVHRAVDAALVGLDRLAQRHPGVVVLATSNFPGAIDPALSSRADLIIRIPVPDPRGRRLILEHTIAAVAAAFPGAQPLLAAAVLDRAAQLAEGLDGRRLRKAVAVACANEHCDPERVTPEDLYATLRIMGEEQ